MRDPQPAAVLSARIAKAYPSLSAYSAAFFAEELLRIERAQRTHATRRCNGPRDVRRTPECGEVFGYCKLVPLPAGRSPNPCAPKGTDWTSDPVSEERAGERIAKRIAKWREQIHERSGARDFEAPSGMDCFVELQGDPSGCVLKLRLPGETEARGV
jgi:hypothetical protein